MRWFGWFRRRPADASSVLETIALQEGTPLGLVGGRMRAMGVPYALPRDLEEVNRLDFQHYMLRYALQGLFAAPLNNPASILDVGTGTGRWALEMAQVFPQAKVIGVDINPPPADQQATAARDVRPPNYGYTPGNVLEGLPFADGTFDFVHMRLLFTALPSDRWPLVIRELARVTRPGGWVESVETTGLHDGGPHTEQLMEWIRQLSARRTINFDDVTHVTDFMRATGLGQVAGSLVKVPTGLYGGRLGSLVASDFLAVSKGYGGLIVGAGVTSQEAFNQTIEGMRRDFNTPAYRCYTPFYVAIGQRGA
jgi:ubiquinone/menaquinone biosynthesis C-methylase UbiE